MHPYEGAVRGRLNPERRALKRNANIVAAGGLMLFTVPEGIYYLLSKIFPIEVIRANISVISFIVFIITFSLASILMISWIRIPVKAAIPLKPVRTGIIVMAVFCCLGITVIGGLLQTVVSWVIEAGFGVTPIMPDLTPPASEDGFALALYFFNIAVAPAFLEEVMYRGVIMQSLRRFGDTFALVTSSVMFAIAHGNLVQGPNSLLMGLAMGFFVLRTSSLWTGIIIHFANNGIAVFMDITMRNVTGNTELESIFTSVFFMIYVVGSIAAGFYLTKRHPQMLSFEPSKSMISQGTRYIWFFTAVMQIALIAATIMVTSNYFEAL